MRPHQLVELTRLDPTLRLDIRYATPNLAARKLINPGDLKNPAIYPPPEVLANLEFLKDVGAATRLYDQVWSQVKAR